MRISLFRGNVYPAAHPYGTCKPTAVPILQTTVYTCRLIMPIKNQGDDICLLQCRRKFVEQTNIFDVDIVLQMFALGVFMNFKSSP